MDRLFEDSFVRPRGFGFAGDFAGSLPLDVTNTGDALVVEAALPGVKPEDVNISLEDGTLTIAAESREEREEKKGETLISEIRRGSFSRTVALPAGLVADKAGATFENGVLRLTIPRAEAVKPRQIRITPTIDGQSSKSDGQSSKDSPVQPGATPAETGTTGKS
jgi:HSP20 family protein